LEAASAAKELDVTKRAIKKKLSNPFALAAQGFVVGSLLFWATVPEGAQAQAPVPAMETSSQPTF